MAITLQFFDDATLTLPLSQLAMRLESGKQVRRCVYLSSLRAEAVFTPARAPLTLTVAAANGQQLPGEWRLAHNEADLASAAPGQALELATPLQGGADNARPIWLQWNYAGSAGAWQQFGLQLGEVIEA
ncbi:hypothetical protein [Chromobacterium haemolyticum]|uniref:hypothetical protein n=1 Tax=Chromobacterium haemolyticum TaxID=394935 RepID=UPI000DEFDCE6|nr:hypothetical protein [Chromobacterium haemolyticum]